MLHLFWTALLPHHYFKIFLKYSALCDSTNLRPPRQSQSAPLQSCIGHLYFARRDAS